MLFFRVVRTNIHSVRVLYLQRIAVFRTISCAFESLSGCWVFALPATSHAIGSRICDRQALYLWQELAAEPRYLVPK